VLLPHAKLQLEKVGTLQVRLQSVPLQETLGPVLFIHPILTIWAASVMLLAVLPPTVMLPEQVALGLASSPEICGTPVRSLMQTPQSGLLATHACSCWTPKAMTATSTTEQKSTGRANRTQNSVARARRL
jgi:hypothetical protein